MWGTWEGGLPGEGDLLSVPHSPAHLFTRAPGQPPRGVTGLSAPGRGGPREQPVATSPGSVSWAVVFTLTSRADRPCASPPKERRGEGRCGMCLGPRRAQHVPVTEAHGPPSSLLARSPGRPSWVPVPVRLCPHAVPFPERLARVQRSPACRPRRLAPSLLLRPSWWPAGCHKFPVRSLAGNTQLLRARLFFLSAGRAGPGPSPVTGKCRSSRRGLWGSEIPPPPASLGPSPGRGTSLDGPEQSPVPARPRDSSDGEAWTPRWPRPSLAWPPARSVMRRRGRTLG